MPQPTYFPRFSALQEYLAEHHPELDKKLRPMLMKDVYKELNKHTGLDVGIDDSVEDTAVLYLERFKELDSAS